jgi:hypothetical protein
MTKLEKVKKMVTIALGFALATYLIMSGMAMLEQKNETNTTLHVSSQEVQ